jgi:hypothetical protein
MGKTDKGRSTPEPYIKIPHYLFDSFAWSQLSVNARCAWTEIVRIFNGSNNGRLAMPARRLADRLRISKNTAERALHDLVTFGFIEVSKPSSFARKRLATEYRLTHWPCNVTKALPSKTFMKIGCDRPAIGTMNGQNHRPMAGAHRPTTDPHRPITGTS